ncbi:hypothetical protein IW261DRAFT_258381 [Armillaria novae-zelandiae]|uniref:Uncharacterized protein n=1 Tax=Armillaria novae-zelandiae TaxID=153914 RepID=A0AA39UD81_9AGAR|nr:hypothetical protein IW261DRAFT_258381 [Armillaria novae-zelandiae]
MGTNRARGCVAHGPLEMQGSSQKREWLRTFRSSNLKLQLSLSSFPVQSIPPEPPLRVPRTPLNWPASCSSESGTGVGVVEECDRLGCFKALTVEIVNPFRVVDSESRFGKYHVDVRKTALSLERWEINNLTTTYIHFELQRVILPQLVFYSEHSRWSHGARTSHRIRMWWFLVKVRGAAANGQVISANSIQILMALKRVLLSRTFITAVPPPKRSSAGYMQPASTSSIHTSRLPPSSSNNSMIPLWAYPRAHFRCTTR